MKRVKYKKEATLLSETVYPSIPPFKTTELPLPFNVGAENLPIFNLSVVHSHQNMSLCPTGQKR
jgi:hypothetical protein